MKSFMCSDGRVLEVIPGFREQVLSYRAPVTPKADWGEAEYSAAAEKKERRLKHLLNSFSAVWGKLDRARILDVGCGDGANCFLLAREKTIQMAVGIDLHLPLVASDQKGELTRKLLERMLGPGPHREADLLQMDGTRMAFGDESFDIVMSRSAMEHIKPVEVALEEMTRVVRSGGLIYLGIDPFYWVRGCHKRGVVDIPWAHARMSLEDYTRFVSEYEDPGVSAKRRERLETLNRFTVGQWRTLIDSIPPEVLKWEQRQSKVGQDYLDQFPGISNTSLPGVAVTDLLTERIEVWLRKR